MTSVKINVKVIAADFKLFSLRKCPCYDLVLGKHLSWLDLFFQKSPNSDKLKKKIKFQSCFVEFLWASEKWIVKCEKIVVQK